MFVVGGIGGLVVLLPTLVTLPTFFRQAGGAVSGWLENHSGTFEDFKKTYLKNNPCDIFRPITLFTSVVRKYACKHSNKMYQSHSMYELELDPEISTIQELLNNSITSKNVPGDEGQCPIDHCQTRSRYSIDTYLMELPKYLIVLLKRYIFNLDEGRARKIKDMDYQSMDR